MRETKLGFNPNHVLTASVSLLQADYPTTAKVKTYAEQAPARLAARPEVQAVGVVNSLPLSQAGMSIRGRLVVEGESYRARLKPKLRDDDPPPSAPNDKKQPIGRRR